jgi:hypothetical protein
LLAHATVPTELAGGRDYDVVVPWLMVGSSVNELRWQSGRQPLETWAGPALHALGDDEKLVGTIDEGATAAATQLFPDKKITTVAVDPARLAADPPVAWEALDALILTPAADSSLHGEIAAILAGGTVIAVLGGDRPDSQWPWHREGPYWLLAPIGAGPDSALNADGYGPTYAWDRGWLEPMRRTIMIVAGLYCMVILAIVLWRSRWAIFALVGASVISAGLFARWYSLRSPILRLQTGVLVEHTAGLAQLDAWTWLSPVRPAEGRISFEGNIRPVFASLRQIEISHIQLVWPALGSPAHFELHLDPRQTMAFMERTVGLSKNQPASDVVSPELAEFAAALYRRPSDQPFTQFMADGGNGVTMPIVVIRSD